MALPCLGYLFESDSVCMCCTSCLYPLIRDRCGPLGSHQERNEATSPPSYSPHPDSLSRSLFPAKELRRIALLPCLLPCKGHITHSCQRAEESVQSAKVSVATNHMEKLERRFFFFFWGGGFIKARGRGKGDIKARCGSLS